MSSMIWRCVLAIAMMSEVGCGSASPEPSPEPTEPIAEPEAPPRIEIHEWGLIDGNSLHAGHATRIRPAALRAPVLYAHLPEGVDEARFDLTVRLGAAHRIMEHYPGGGALVAGEPLVWNGVQASSGQCGSRTYPNAGGGGCRTEDRICEAQHGRRWETRDGACLRYGEQSWDHLFYRAQLGPVELPLRHTIDGDVVRATSEQTLVGMIYRTHDGKVSWVDPPSTGAAAELRVPDESDADAASARIKADLAFHGLTPEEADAFLREWDDLFGGRFLLYWLPEPTLESIATLEGENLDFKRAVLVRIPLS